MQTFLPYKDFAESARVLDRARLGRQRVECLQILNVLLGVNEKAGWKNHPAVRMWKGYEPGLLDYSLAMCREWVLGRGYKDTVADTLRKLPIYVVDWSTDWRQGLLLETQLPPWLGDEEFHRSHRSNLLRKDETFYRKLGWTEPNDLPYKWPV